MLKSYILLRKNYYIWHLDIPMLSASLRNSNKYVHIKGRVTHYTITICLKITSITIYKATIIFARVLKLIYYSRG